MIQKFLGVQSLRENRKSNPSDGTARDIYRTCKADKDLSENFTNNQSLLQYLSFGTNGKYIRPTCLTNEHINKHKCLHNDIYYTISIDL